MWKIIKIASAFIGIIVGAGFASGKEVLQYFVSFGYWGLAGVVLSTALFAYVGMMLVKIGSRLQTVSHREAIFKISGKFFGTIIDYVLIFTLFGISVAMVAGAGTVLNQQFGIPTFVGALIMIALIVLTALFNVGRFVAILGSVTPFLILAMIIIAGYSIITFDGSITALEPIASGTPTTLPNWYISALNYVSFNVAVGASMSLVMGGDEKDERTAAIGGLVGGLGIGFLILLGYVAVFSKIDYIAAYDMPLLEIITEISPFLGIFMTLVLFGMIFNTGASMFYAFIARFFFMGTKKGVIATFVVGTIVFLLSFLGFTGVVAKFYPLIGYLGLFLMGVLFYAPFKLKKIPKITE